jgi:hypothetical protein
MKIKLIPIKNDNKKNVYIIDVRFMYGDADGYEHREIVCEDEAYFLEKVAVLKAREKEQAEDWNGSLYNNKQWAREHEDWLDVPYDPTTDGNSLCVLDGLELYYYDHHGIQWKVEVEE